MRDLQATIQALSLRHDNLCPRQILGVRMALAGAEALGLELPRKDKNLVVISETDGCFVDGLEVAAGISPGQRTLRIEDYGKVAATFINVLTSDAVRLAPQPDVRERAFDYVPEETRHYFAQLLGYQRMSDSELFSFTAVKLSPSIEEIVSLPGLRVNCCVCGEEIMNEREVMAEGLAYCRTCFGTGYYREKEVAFAAALMEPHLIKSA